MAREGRLLVEDTGRKTAVQVKSEGGCGTTSTTARWPGTCARAARVAGDREAARPGAPGMLTTLRARRTRRAKATR
jgi:hypothetical protein